METGITSIAFNISQAVEDFGAPLGPFDESDSGTDDDDLDVLIYSRLDDPLSAGFQLSGARGV